MHLVVVGREGGYRGRQLNILKNESPYVPFRFRFMDSSSRGKVLRGAFQTGVPHVTITLPS